MVVDGYRELERMLREFGLRQLEELAGGWQGHGFGPAETAQWLTAGVGADEPQLAAALAAAEWTPAQALNPPRLYTVSKPSSFSALPPSADRPPEAQ